MQSMLLALTLKPTIITHWLQILFYNYLLIIILCSGIKQQLIIKLIVSCVKEYLLQYFGGVVDRRWCDDVASTGSRW